MSGGDAVIVQAMQRRADAEVHTLPIVTTLKTHRDYSGEDSSTIHCRVFPLTDFHIEQLLGRCTAEAEPEWLQRLNGLSKGEGIPFFTISKLSKSGVTWWHQSEQIENTGNECRAEEEDSVYLQYAVVALPKPTAQQEPAAAEQAQ